MKQLLGRGRRVRVQRYVMSVALLVPLLLSLRAAAPQDPHLSVLPATGAQVYGFGDALAFGALNSLAAPIVGMAVTPSGGGYFLVGADGGVFAFGDAVFRGSMGGRALAAPIVGMAVTPSGNGYFLVGADGGVFAFGDAVFRGSMSGRALAAPIVGMAVTPRGGYFLAASDGGVFAFGAARFRGSMRWDCVENYQRSRGFGEADALRVEGCPLAEPIVAIEPTPSGNGYYLVGADGGVFAFGDAVSRGSMGGGALAAPIVGMAVTPSGTATTSPARTVGFLPLVTRPIAVRPRRMRGQLSR